jgi:hypothetical protein
VATSNAAGKAHAANRRHLDLEVEWTMVFSRQGLEARATDAATGERQDLAIEPRVSASGQSAS